MDRIIKNNFLKYKQKDENILSAVNGVSHAKTKYYFNKKYREDGEFNLVVYGTGSSENTIGVELKNTKDLKNRYKSITGKSLE